MFYFNSFLDCQYLNFILIQDNRRYLLFFFLNSIRADFWGNRPLIGIEGDLFMKEFVEFFNVDSLNNPINALKQSTCVK